MGERAIDIDALTPHAGAMRLIDRVIRHDETCIVCEADSHRAADHPLRRAGGVPIICALEYGAQAMAIHGALLAKMGAKPRVGYLVAAHELHWHGSTLDAFAAPLTVAATRLFGSDNQVAYEFTVSAAGTAVLRGRASVVLSSE